jgi:V/A-type H+-transporting ATPase subunit E
MAGADRINQKILDEARQQSEANIKVAEMEAEALIDGAKAEAQTKREIMLEKAKKDMLERQKRLLSIAELEGRKHKLQTKQDMLDKVFKKAVEKLNSFPMDQYEKILADMIISIVKNGDEEIVLSKKDAIHISNGFIPGINERLKSKGVQGNVKLSDKTQNINGGFILKAGDIEINSSFEALIRMQREQLEEELVKILFHL